MHDFMQDERTRIAPEIICRHYEVFVFLNDHIIPVSEVDSGDPQYYYSL